MQKSAIQFYKQIEKEQDKFRLVNNLFIVRYITKDICIYIGEFNKGVINRVNVNPNLNLRYVPTKRIMTTTLGIWRTLDIQFIEKPIKEILK